MSSRTYVHCEDQNLGGPNSQAASSNKLIFSSGPYLPYSSTSGPLTAQPINLPTETSTNPSPKSHLPSHLSKNNESKVKNQFIHKHIHKSQKNLNLKNSKSERERIGQQNPILSSISHQSLSFSFSFSFSLRFSNLIPQIQRRHWYRALSQRKNDHHSVFDRVDHLLQLWLALRFRSAP